MWEFEQPRKILLDDRFYELHDDPILSPYVGRALDRVALVSCHSGNILEFDTPYEQPLDTRVLESGVRLSSVHPP
jgi:hypothetical protein